MSLQYVDPRCPYFRQGTEKGSVGLCQSEKGRLMSFWKHPGRTLALAGFILVASQTPAFAQTHYGFVLEREGLAVAYARLGTDSDYDHVMYAARRGGQPGYYFVYFRNGCRGQSGYGRSWGFKPWDGAQRSGDLFELLGEATSRHLTDLIQCGGGVPDANVFPSRASALIEMRHWQGLGG